MVVPEKTWEISNGLGYGYFQMHTVFYMTDDITLRFGYHRIHTLHTVICVFTLGPI